MPETKCGSRLNYNYTANDYRQTTDELIFKSVVSTQRCIKKWNIVECAINK